MDKEQKRIEDRDNTIQGIEYIISIIEGKILISKDPKEIKTMKNEIKTAQSAIEIIKELC